ncbi:MAG: DUF3466 family protein, partial [Planctomycetota bacterium]
MIRSSTSGRHATPASRPVLEALEPRQLLSADFALQDLQTLGGANSWAMAVNDVGQVVGSSETGASYSDGSPVSHAFLWSDALGMVDLGTLGGRSSWAYGVNNAGMVVGTSETGQVDQWGSRVTRPFLWTPSGGMQGLGTFGGPSGSALDINDFGEVTGWAHTRSGVYHAFYWSSGNMWDLGTLYDGETSTGEAINYDGSIVGASGIGSFDGQDEITSAFLSWVDDATGDRDALEDLGSDAGSEGWSHANDINFYNEVVGWSDVVEGDGQVGQHAYMWGPDGVRDISLADGTSEAFAVNDHVEVVAVQQDAEGASIPYMWTADGVTRLDTNYNMSDAADINNSGQIVGAFWDGQRENAALLDPARPHLTIEDLDLTESD